MIKQFLFLFAVALSYAAAFVPLATVPLPTVAVQQPQQLLQQKQQSASPLMNQGIHSFLIQQEEASATSSSSVTLSLKERHIPTPEEIAAKKRNFNFWYVLF